MASGYKIQGTGSVISQCWSCYELSQSAQVDTAMTEKTLQAMDPETGAVTPPNFVPDRFTHFTCDNIDINDASLDGKNSFHTTVGNMVLKGT